MAVEISTADVYETASIIGQDFEKLIDVYGHEAVVDLMPKIVRVLEQMEEIVADREKQFMEMAGLKMENERLYGEIRKEASLRRRLEEEMYDMKLDYDEENGGKESEFVSKLQEENRKLKVEVEAHAEYEQVGQNLIAGDIEVMHKMKETIDQQRDVLRSKNSEVNSLRDDIEAMDEQIIRLTDVNQSVRRQMNTAQSNLNEAIKEKTKLQAEVQGLLQELEQLRDPVIKSDDETMKENELQTLETHEKSETVVEKETVDSGFVENHFSEQNQKEDKKGEHRNPDRPRFTLKELQKVLWERDLLKMQVHTLEEELSHYKPSDEETHSGDSGRSSPVKKKDILHSPTETVQRESGISKFFHLFWREKNKMSKSSSGEWEVVSHEIDTTNPDESPETDKIIENTEPLSTDL